MIRLDASGSTADRAEIVACLEAIEGGALEGAAERAARERDAG